jgi:hypothetical protein
MCQQVLLKIDNTYWHILVYISHFMKINPAVSSCFIRVERQINERSTERKEFNKCSESFERI